MKLKKFDKIEVEWSDTKSLEGTWLSEENIMKQIDIYDKDIEMSVGYFIRYCKGWIVLSSMRSKRMDNSGVTQMIPRGCIKNIKKLR